MPYRISIYFDQAYALITVKDWLSNNICVNTKTGKPIDKVAVNKGDTLEVLIGQKDNVGGVVIHEAADTTYEIPLELDETGKITFPKPKRALQSDLDNLDAKVNALAQQIAGNKRGK
ncbi:hypothetical protein B5K11_32105 [Rhizobium leguminosarum bv. trifolii]|uniref:hypothetical protein n=1 Tax=Rhizobium leguminosarum TaxID=384 RepID=UPI000E2E6863|nr:hypothetical protein [Rhizobium leguminosarum]RFB84785.1 hypothetical protein B5K11_32105 [Rhizobium leguminosarum bv. trifolii]